MFQPCSLLQRYYNSNEQYTFTLRKKILYFSVPNHEDIRGIMSLCSWLWYSVHPQLHVVTPQYPLDRRLLVFQGQCGHGLYLFMVYLLVLVIIINDMIAYSELYMMCTSYLSTNLEGMWKSTKITGKPVSMMRF